MTAPSTLPPTEADEAAAAFELEIAELGEPAARWNRLVDLLEERDAGAGDTWPR